MRRLLPVFLILFVLLTSCETTRVAERVGVLAAKETFRHWSHEYELCLLRKNIEKLPEGWCLMDSRIRDSHLGQYKAMERIYIEKWGVEP